MRHALRCSALHGSPINEALSGARDEPSDAAKSRHLSGIVPEHSGESAGGAARVCEAGERCACVCSAVAPPERARVASPAINDSRPRREEQ